MLYHPCCTIPKHVMTSNQNIPIPHMSKTLSNGQWWNCNLPAVSCLDPTGDNINETGQQYLKMNSLLFCKAPLQWERPNGAKLQWWSEASVRRCFGYKSTCRLLIYFEWAEVFCLGYYFLYSDPKDKTTKIQSAAKEENKANLCWRRSDSMKLQW